MMKRTLLTAGAVLLSLAMVAPAEARRSKASQADRSEWSEEQEARPARRSHEARNFWEDTDSSSERPARRVRQARAVSDDESSERPARRARHVSNDSDSGNSGGNYSVGGRPGAWCGWYMRTQRGGGPELNLAWNWSKWGSASSPQVGAVVVWPHHVGEITGQTADGQWIVRSGNDGGRVRERARSVSGAVFRMG